MNTLIPLSLLFFCTFFLCVSSYAQEKHNYFNTIAGDSAINFNEKLIREDIGDTVIIKLNEGFYRLVLNEGIKLNEDINIQVFSEQGNRMELHENENYIDFFNSATNNLRFISTAKKTIQKNNIAEIFWVYNKNTLRDAPLFQLKDIEGNEYTNESLKGKIVVVNFWGIWCAPCRREIPQLNKLVRQHEDRADIIFIAVSSDPVKKLNTFIQNTPFNYRLISDKNATVLKTEFINLGMIVFPSHIILNKNGDIVLQYLGEHPTIEQLLASCIEKQK